MSERWANWAGEQRCAPIRIEHPGSRDELCEAVARAAGEGRRIRASASGHSFTDIALTDDVMFRLDRLNRVLDADPRTGRVRVEAGIGLGELNRRLDAIGRAFENLGDIDRQTLAGAISTGTHGTGARFRSISAQVEALEIVVADGSIREISADDAEALAAARVGLGALGLIYAVTVRTVPAYTLSRVDSPRPLNEVLASLDELNERNDHFEFYVFPHTDVALCRETRRSDEPPRPKPRALVYAQEVVFENWGAAAFVVAARHVPQLRAPLARFVSRTTGRSTKVDRSFKVFASERRIKFTEMEYGIPREHAADAVRRVLEAAARPEHGVVFPIEVRFVAADDALLSASHGRDTCYIAVHHDRRRDWEPYLREVEAIANEYGGRPHWGKRHFQTAETLAPRYPGWDEFGAQRAKLDPDGVFSNAYTDRVLGPVAARNG